MVYTYILTEAATAPATAGTAGTEFIRLQCEGMRSSFANLDTIGQYIDGNSWDIQLGKRRNVVVLDTELTGNTGSTAGTTEYSINQFQMFCEAHKALGANDVYLWAKDPLPGDSGASAHVQWFEPYNSAYYDRAHVTIRQNDVTIQKGTATGRVTLEVL